MCESHPECDAEWENFLLSDDATSSEIVSLGPRSPSVTTTALTDLVHEASRALGPS